MIGICLAIMDTAEEESMFESIYYGYRKQMYVVAKNILQDDTLVEDALQNAFLGIAKQITHFQEFTPDQTRAYVLTVAKNAACQLYNRTRKENDWVISFEEIRPQSDKKDIAREIIARDNVRRMLAVILTLPPTYRDILTLRYAFDMKNDEIAVALGKSRGAVRQHMTRARQALKIACQKEGIIFED